MTVNMRTHLITIELNVIICFNCEELLTIILHRCNAPRLVCINLKRNVRNYSNGV